jgi:pyrroline-5-carboxylate reductase
MDKKKVTIVGCGKMGGAILAALSSNDKYEVTGVEVKSDLRNELAGRLGLKITENIVDAGISDVYVLAVKPQNMAEMLKELSGVLAGSSEKVLVVSVAAGITIEYIKGFLSDVKEVSVVRVMPNTPAIINEGVTAIAADEAVTADERGVVEGIFKSMGVIINVEENLIDAVTALSGSGPAYMFYIAEVMEKFGIEMGIDKDVAHLLAAKTIHGAGKLMLDANDKSFEQLRKDVTSPGGTTEAAIKYMDSKSFNKIFYEALNSAKNRAEEMKKEL